jgi:hypothetical protein
VASNTRRDDEATGTGAALSKIGVRVEVLNARVAQARQISDRLKGVVVTSVTPGSPADWRLVEDDVISELRIPRNGSVERIEVTAPADLQRELASTSACWFTEPPPTGRRRPVWRTYESANRRAPVMATTGSPQRAPRRP